MIDFIPVWQTVCFGGNNKTFSNEIKRLRPIIIDGQNVAVEHGKENSIRPVLGSTGYDWKKNSAPEEYKFVWNISKNVDMIQSLLGSPKDQR